MNETNEINKIEIYFNSVNLINFILIKENHAVKKLSKYVAAFDHMDKILIILSA